MVPNDISVALKTDDIQLRTIFEDSFSEEIWKTTYKDHNDKTVDDTLFRVARAVASVEETDAKRAEWTGKFYDLLSNFKATSGGRIYSNAGTEWNGTTLMNCFVGPRINHDIDSLEGILTHLKAQSFTLKSEGGWGENFSYIRPRGSFIHGIGVETPGAVKYMELFDKSSEIITAGSGKKAANGKAKGKIRKGAMMGVMDVWHPDVIEFITAKQQPGRLTKFNLSVNCTDEFMQKVIKVIELDKEIAYQLTRDHVTEDQKVAFQELKNNRDSIDAWNLRFPDTQHPQYKTKWTGNLAEWEKEGYPSITYQTVSATWLWNLMMESTYNRAEPGVLFLDRANYFNPLNYLETIQATNPCGEQTLSPGNVCNLGSINLTQFVNKDRTGFDMQSLRTYARYLVRFLDNVSTLSDAPLPEYTQSMKNKRRIGCGILGWGSALYMLKIPFGSDQAANLRDYLMEEYAKEVYCASIDLAEEKGMFPYCNPDKHTESPFIRNLRLPKDYTEKLKQVGIRNSSCLSIQPTGNTSIFANIVSGGLEPVFMPEYVRTVIVSEMPDHIVTVTPKWYEGEWCETDMFKFSREGDEEILKGVDSKGTVYKIDKNRGLTKEVLCEDYGVRALKKTNEWDPTAKWAKTTMNLSAQDHINDLKGFARWVDSAISKTVNVPNEYPLEDFKGLYLDAYKTGYIKGVTTYRAGTMTTVLSAKEEKNADPCDEEIIKEDVKLPDSAPAVMKTLRAEGKKYYVTVVYHEDNPDRPFALFVKSNHHESSTTTSDAVDQLLKLARKKKIPKKHIDNVESKILTDNNANKVARAISLLLRHGVLIKNIVTALDRVEDVFVGSFIFQIKKFLAAYIKDGDKVEDEVCPECGSANIVYQEGCKRCLSCSNSKCG